MCSKSSVAEVSRRCRGGVAGCRGSVDLMFILGFLGVLQPVGGVRFWPISRRHHRDAPGVADFILIMPTPVTLLSTLKWYFNVRDSISFIFYETMWYIYFTLLGVADPNKAKL